VGERWQPRGDSKVSTMLEFVDGWVPERRDILVERFGIDLDWTVNALSDGRKRRVQLLLAFARPSEVLLLDEVTTDLDVLARETLLQWLREESEQRGVTVLFSTHIFDGLEEWGTHMTYVQDGKIGCNAELGAVSEVKELRAKGCLTPLYTFVEAMVTRDSQMQRAAGRKSTRCSMPVGMVVN
jgi:CCR4-NOT complex subunit CAF16